MAAERTGWRAASPRRLIAFLSQAEERPAVPAAGRAADAALAVAATVAAVVAVILQLRTTSGPVGIFVARPGFPVVELGHPHGTWPTPVTLLGVVLTTAPLAFRRIYPITAFCVILAAVIGTTRYATAITFAAVIFAAYCAVAYSAFRRLALLSVLAAAVVVTAAYPNTTPPVPERFTALLVLLPTVAVGVAIRVWRRRAGESAERLRQAQAEHEAQTLRAVELERARIASEMHDVVTHNVSVMVVQAGAARRVLGSSPGAAREALLAVEASGRTAMTELRHLLGLLAPAGDAAPEVSGLEPAGGEAVLSPQPDLGQVGSLVDRVRAAGLPAELSVVGRRGLPPGLDLAAYRVVQEALTNVMKHAGQARTAVRIEYRPRELLIAVSDDGRPADSPPAAARPGQPPGPGGGRGLIGLRERLAVYGGSLDAGPRPGGGWRLAVRVPLEPAADCASQPGLPGLPPFLAASS